MIDKMLHLRIKICMRCLLFFMVIGVFLLTLSACSPQPIQQESYVFGTKVTITLYHADAEVANHAAASVLRAFDQYHARFSVQEKTSEISQLNRAFAQNRAFIGSGEMATQIGYAQKYYVASGGWFNPAIGNYLKKWHFNEPHLFPEYIDKNQQKILSDNAPNPMDITIKLPEHCLDAVKSTFDQNPTVCFRSHNQDVSLDFGGMGKGDALDLARNILADAKMTSALINIGGNIMVIGKKPDGSKWQVALQHPREEKIMARLDLDDGDSIGTSGDYQRYFKHQNQRYCHLINPFDANAACVKQSATVLVQKKPRAGLLSDIGSKPLFFAADTGLAKEMMQHFAITDFFWVNNDGSIVVSERMHKRIHWQGKLATITVLPE